MPNQLPYVIYGTITDSTATAVVSARVVVRNDSNGEKISVTTDGSGKYVADLGNLTSGYLTTDRFTVICGYGNEEEEASYLVSSDTHLVDLALVEVAESSDLTYCQVQDVYDELGDKTDTDISYSRIRKLILRAEAEIDDRAGTKFKSTTVTNEIYDFNQYNSYKSPEQLRGYTNDFIAGNRNDHWNTNYNDRFFIKKSPVLTITSLYKNSAGVSEADSWGTALTQQTGSGGDFVVDLDSGMVTFVNNMPSTGARRIKITYTYGFSSVPKVVERLCILLTIRDVLLSKGNSSQFDSVDNISLEGISISKGIGGSISYFNYITKEIDNLWKIVGEMSSEVV